MKYQYPAIVKELQTKLESCPTNRLSSGLFAPRTVENPLQLKGKGGSGDPPQAWTLGVGSSGSCWRWERPLLLTHVLKSVLYGVKAIDAPSFCVAAVLLAGIGLAACYVSTRKACAVDPMMVLSQRMKWGRTPVRGALWLGRVLQNPLFGDNR